MNYGINMISIDAYTIIKDLISLAKANNNQPMVELAMEAQSKLFDLRDEIQKLKDENSQLKKEKDLDDDIVKHPNGYITLRSDIKNGQHALYYCGACWAKSIIKMPLKRMTDFYSNNEYRCFNKDCYAPYNI